MFVFTSVYIVHCKIPRSRSICICDCVSILLHVFFCNGFFLSFMFFISSEFLNSVVVYRISGIIFDPIKGSIWAESKYIIYFGWFFFSLIHLSVDAWKKWAKMSVLYSFSLFWVDRSWLCAPQKLKKSRILFVFIEKIMSHTSVKWLTMNDDQFK